jgi:hypothetical protein
MFDILPKTQIEIQKHLHESAAKHAERSNGFLVCLPVEPDIYPGQSILDPVIKSSGTLGPNEADIFASGVDNRYSNLISAYDDYTDESATTYERFQHIEQAVLSGTNIVNGTDHAELVDIIFNHLHVVNRLKRAQMKRANMLEEKPEKRMLRSSVIVSKMIDFLGIETDGVVTPVRDLLALGFDKTYLTIPRTGSTEGWLEKTGIKTYNKYVRSEIASDLEQRAFTNRKPMVLGVALPGTVIKESAENPNTWIVGKANEGILDFTRKALLVVSAVRMREQGSSVFIDTLPRNVHTDEQLHNMMGRLTVGISELDGKKYIYDSTGTAPVIEPNAFRIS